MLAQASAPAQFGTEAVKQGIAPAVIIVGIILLAIVAWAAWQVRKD